MSTLTIETKDTTVKNVVISDDAILVDLSAGRSISTPIVRFPRLYSASEKERNNWRIIGNGEGIHWPDLDKDINKENILTGTPAQESASSFKEWLADCTNITKPK
jgi:hypothetical protein